MKNNVIFACDTTASHYPIQTFWFTAGRDGLAAADADVSEDT